VKYLGNRKIKKEIIKVLEEHRKVEHDDFIFLIDDWREERVEEVLEKLVKKKKVCCGTEHRTNYNRMGEDSFYAKEEVMLYWLEGKKEP